MRNDECGIWNSESGIWNLEFEISLDTPAKIAQGRPTAAGPGASLLVTNMKAETLNNRGRISTYKGAGTMLMLALVYRTVGLILLLAAVGSFEASAQSVTSCASLAGEVSKHNFVVVGRVVGEDGRPVKGADVSIDPRGSTEMLNPYESASSDENGCFRFVGFGGEKAWKSEWFLYTTDDFVSPGVSPINPPFVGHLRSIDSRYNGIPFVPGDRRVVDMGDVPVVFHYGSAKLRFDDCPENKCSSSIKWEMAGVSIVHCDSKKWIERSNFSLEQQEKYIEKEDDDLIFMLPMGRWKVQFYNGYESFRKDELVAETACFDVKLNEVFDVPVKLTRTSRR